MEAAPALSIAQLAQRPLVTPSRPTALRMLLERHMVDASCRPLIAMEVVGVSSILELVSEGIGLAVLPEHVVRSAPQPGRYMLHRIGAGPTEQGWLVPSARRATTPTQQVLMDLLRTQMALLRASTRIRA
ncbi:LysR substrate-binding domain-containing protein [Paraburkholderia adhaesiva]|uniref:LysR substrate-binding domain-containing protein n=1 Tax=Paraburkholderia adhaesiva TaxID=2883244 RepID=UPI001F2B83CE|nr:LysR substrate-binding domain-containing protein [Paraburkholderia adhaesiva]